MEEILIDLSIILGYVVISATLVGCICKDKRSDKEDAELLYLQRGGGFFESGDREEE